MTLRNLSQHIVMVPSATDGSVTKYSYSATGQKLGVEYRVAAPNVSNAFGVEPDALSQAQTLYAGSKQYGLGGSLIFKNGMTDRYLFDGGYAKATMVSPTNYRFAFYYYNRDHLGNIREVVNSAGTVCQVINYYPSGVPYTETNSVMNAGLQPYKYNGKELDRMHGLDTYDYGARQYNPIVGRWDRMDPLCEKYYDVSPYVYCANNPVRYIDPDGREIWIYYDDENGQPQSFQYTAGMKCNVDNSIAQALVSNLNTMHTNDSGAIVLDAIISSDIKYGYPQADTYSEGGEGYLDPAKNTVYMGDANNTLSLAEETFHIFQSVNNQGGTTAVNEVEAKLFSAKLNFEISKWNNGEYLNNLIGKDGYSYSDDMFSLFKDGYDERHFRSAVNCFFSASLSGLYYKEVLKYERGTISHKPLIADFLPAKNF